MANKYIDVAVEKSSDCIDEEMSWKIEFFMKVYDKCLNTYIAKNLDYGDSFSKLYRKFGLESSVIRLWDKLNRLDSLIYNQRQVDDESVKDTLEDMINYCTMTLMEMGADD